ncbi:MAG: hypothetical protein HYZ75_03615 [Elusimicrobia bacterium]|nr:hypothetical protein [Elusimicrobiota bacterium]
MKPTNVRIYNLIPFLSGRADGIKRMEGRPEKVLALVRETCEEKERSLAAWAEGIEGHCPIPFGHPYRRYSDRLPEGDPLKALGCWAFGAGNSWITIEEITWDDGSVSHPQQDHREWLKRQSAALFASGMGRPRQRL